MLVRLDESGVAFPSALPRFANLFANFLFVLTVYLKVLTVYLKVLTVYLKARRDVPEVAYVSINYPKKRE